MALIFIALLACLGLVAFTAFIVGILGHAGRTAQISFWAISAVASAASWWTTTRIEYSLDENMRAIGWPIPGIILARDDANSLWLDYVGLNTMLALPMNAIIFLVVPSIIFLGVWFVLSRRIRSNRAPARGPSLDTD
jgi:hypothetical protein